MKKNTIKQILTKPVALITLAALVLSMVPAGPYAQAGTLSSARIYLNTVKTDTGSGVSMIILVKPATVGTENKLVLTFPTGSNDNGKWCRTAGALTVVTDTTKETATAMPGSLTAACTASPDIITISGLTDLTVGTLYGVKVSGAIGTGLEATTGVITVTTQTSGSATIDSKNVTVDIIANDQISVTGTVDPGLTFAITDATVTLGTLTSSTTGKDTAAFTVGTNAQNGYVADISGTTLTDPDSHTITAIGATGAASTTGIEQFGLNLKLNTTPAVGVEPTGGHGAAAGAYATANSFAYQSGDTIASYTGPSATTTFTASFIANIGADTEAGVYSSSLTLTATGKF